MQNCLSREHTEIKNEVNNTLKDIIVLSEKFDNEKEKKKTQYELLIDSDKEIVKSIEKISLLKESLEENNFLNIKLKHENQLLQQENEILRNQLSKYQEIQQDNNYTQGLER